MPTYEISGYGQYQVDTSTNASSFQGTTVQNFTFDDGEGDATYELGDVLGVVAGNDLNYLGNMQVDLVGGGTMELALVQGAASFVDPNVIEVLVVVPAAMSVTDFVFPDPIDYSSRETDSFPTCFAAGTEISTAQGNKAVETLEIGDMVAKSGGGYTAVKWIGRQTITSFFAGQKAQPVCIQAGALGGGLPLNELTVTADHGMIIDDFVINASALVNGDTITFVPLAKLDDRFVVYHVETEEHDVILANGAPTETFVDAVTRRRFDNYQEYIDLYGVERIIPEMDYLRVSAKRLVPNTIKTRLGIISDTIGSDTLGRMLSR